MVTITILEAIVTFDPARPPSQAPDLLLPQVESSTGALALAPWPLFGPARSLTCGNASADVAGGHFVETIRRHRPSAVAIF